MATGSIADRVAQCLGGFKSISSNHYSAELEESKETAIAAVDDELARFKLWSGNIGAHRTGRSSLDHRLRDSSRLREQVARLLDELANSLDEVKEILSGKVIPWDEEIIDTSKIDTELMEMLKDEEFEFDSELAQLSAEITDIISSLLRLSMSIRNPAPHDHFMSTEYAKATYFSDFDVRHVEAKYKNANPELVRRLGAAISSRRQYFKYRESHHAKLSQGINFDEGHTEAGAKSTVASSIPREMKDSETSAPSFGELDEDDRSETRISQTSYATTTPGSEKLRVPPLPKQHSKGPFECPFCFMLISVANRYQWKKHVLGDLRPYTCLFVNCLTPSKEYGRRHEWMDHVLQIHWKVWRCPASCEESWSSEAGLKQHLQNLHPNIGSAGDLDTVILRCERKKPLDEETECPLCGETLDSIKQYQRHVGKHQVDLALFALPNIDDGRDSEYDEDTTNDSEDDVDDEVYEEDVEIHTAEQRELERLRIAQDRENQRSAEEDSDDAELERAKRDLDEIKRHESGKQVSGHHDPSSDGESQSSSKEVYGGRLREKGRSREEREERMKRAEKERLVKRFEKRRPPTANRRSDYIEGWGPGGRSASAVPPSWSERTASQHGSRISDYVDPGTVPPDEHDDHEDGYYYPRPIQR